MYTPHFRHEMLQNTQADPTIVRIIFLYIIYQNCSNFGIALNKHHSQVRGIIYPVNSQHTTFICTEFGTDLYNSPTMKSCDFF